MFVPNNLAFHCKYNRVVLVCTVNLYIPASLGRRPILRYQVLQVRKKLYSLYLQSEKTDSYVFCREYCKKNEINTAIHLLSAVFIARHFKCRKEIKHNLTYSLRLYFYLLYLGATLM